MPKIEEEIFYPACEGKVEEDLLKEAYVEHDGAKMLIAEIEAGGPGRRILRRQGQGAPGADRASRRGRGKARRGHVRAGRKAGVDMDALGEQLAARKAELIADLPEGRAAQARADDDGRDAGLRRPLAAPARARAGRL